MESSRRITQKEIARRLGVSQALVSCALSGKAQGIGASRETVSRICGLARREGYVPSATALELRGLSTKTIGVVVRDFEDPYLARLIGALQREAREAGHSLLLTGANEEDFHSLRKHRVDGIVLAGSHCVGTSLANLLRAEKASVVQIGWDRQLDGITQVAMDDDDAIETMVMHLWESGHRKIAFGVTAGPTGKRRADAFRKALKKLATPARSCPILTEKTPGDAFGKNPLPRTTKLPWTAIIASDDELALRLSSTFQTRGVRIPEDLSIAGIDDIPAAATGFPPLTTIRQPVEEMAREAIRILAGKRTIRKPEANRILFGGRLIHRESTCPPGKQNQPKPEREKP
jgi:LacI family transcriptional regulator